MPAKYPAYLTPKLIKLIEMYEKTPPQPPVSIHRLVTPQEFMLLQRYSIEQERQMRAQQKDPLYRWYDRTGHNVMQ